MRFKKYFAVLIGVMILVGLGSYNTYAAVNTPFEGNLLEGNTFIRPMTPADEREDGSSFTDVYDASQVKAGTDAYLRNFYAVKIVPSKSGNYTFKVDDAPYDTFLILYKDKFDPAKPLENFMICNDDTSENTLSMLPNISLTANTTYYIVMTSFNTSTTGAVDFSASGSGSVAHNEAAYYMVTFEDYDGAILKSQSVERGLSASAPSEPTRTGYTFDKWSEGFTNVTSDLTITAQYKVNSYKVTFVDYNDTIIKEQTVEYGSAATAPEAPTRDGYAFAGWNNAYNNITSAMTVKATYVQAHTVTFKDYDGSTISTDTVKNGEDATAPSEPTRTGYTFDKWSAGFTNVTSDLTIIAQYKINSYKVTFVDYNDTIINEQNVDYGSAATAPEAPTRDGYVFTGWNTAYNNITSALTVKATYAKLYTVTFVDPDNKTISTVTVKEGNAATAPTPPTRTGYTFDKWSASFTNVAADLTITALYKINSYKVSFVDYNGTTIDEQTVDYGSAATAPSDPTRTGYTFTGWDVAYNNITSALTVTAQYNINSYDVVFKDYEGTELKTESVDYGSAATAPSEPTRTGYTFTGWDVAYNNITSALTVTAQYSINSYNVVFKDYDGTELKTESVNYGSAATAPSEPTRTGYTFTGWDVAYNNITSALTVTAQYNINSYDVVFKDYEGTELKTESVNYGSAATAPSEPTRTGYTFTGWDVAYNNITSALTVTAQYSINSYNVVFKDHDGTELKTESVNYGSAATAPADPTWTGHTFTG
ncbi:InlB B-repeat-containing protein, partial [Fusibacter paucivorans]